MISDPRTTPNSRVGRILFALLVAYGAWYVQFRMFRTNGLALVAGALSLARFRSIDRLLSGDAVRMGRVPTDRAGLTPQRRGDT